MKPWFRRWWTFLSAIALALTGVGCSAVARGHPALAPTPTLSPEDILLQLQAEMIPEEHSRTGYGPDFNQAGYETLITWNQRLRPDPAWAGDYEALDVTIPCCGAAHPFADESRNCGCGHHQALYGVGKYLLNVDHSREEAQAEVDRWRAFFFPRETMLAELQRRAIGDPSLQQALNELEQRGGC